MALLLPKYYALVDAGHVDSALELVEPDVRFAILLPGRAVRGSSPEDLGGYLSGRGDVVRRHVVREATRQGQLEFVYGTVVEDVNTVTGHYLAVARISTEGLMVGYQVAFDPELGLFSGFGESVPEVSA